jgi:hypothetical protein
MLCLAAECTKRERHAEALGVAVFQRTLSISHLVLELGLESIDCPIFYSPSLS